MNTVPCERLKQFITQVLPQTCRAVCDILTRYVNQGWFDCGLTSCFHFRSVTDNKFIQFSSIVDLGTLFGILAPVQLDSVSQTRYEGKSCGKKEGQMSLGKPTWCSVTGVSNVRPVGQIQSEKDSNLAHLNALKNVKEDIKF